VHHHKEVVLIFNEGESFCKHGGSQETFNVVHDSRVVIDLIDPRECLHYTRQLKTHMLLKSQGKKNIVRITKEVLCTI